MTTNKTEVSTQASSSGREKERVAPALLVMFLLGICVVMVGGVSAPQYRVVPALLWSFGFSTAGLLLGFLFGIPRTLPTAATAASEDQAQEKSTTTPQKTAPEVFNEINSNLVEVSDWLTKIIVGVGLVEFKDLSRKATDVAGFIAPSFGLDNATGPAIVCGLMLFFSVLGFLSGYLLTRIYLAIIIKRADIEVKRQTVQLDSGKEIEIGELARLQQSTLNDLQSTVAKFVSASPQPVAGIAPEIAESATAEAGVRILWVDDKPGNNTLLVEQLERDGAVIEQVFTTKQAMAALARHKYKAVISDMVRKEDGVKVPDAGIRLAKAMQQADLQVPIFIYCSKEAVINFESAAQSAGAKIITSSGTRLLAALRPLFEKNG